MILKADSGSTKTTWAIGTMRFNTQGINPFHQNEEMMRNIITNELLTHPAFPDTSEIKQIEFYGAGCTKEKALILQSILQGIFSSSEKTVVDSDMFGAAKALFENREGIACILGTGANSCLYDGSKIIENISPMGYILGDEGSGAMIGKTFINLLYKGEHRDFIPTFEKETNLTLPMIIQRVYREPLPNRFLASLCPFIKRHIEESWIEKMITDCFRLFFQRNVSHYNRPDLSCSFIGSIALYFQEQLQQAATAEGYTIERIMQAPL